MIQILTVKDIQKKKDLCQKAQIAYSDDLYIIAVFDNNETILEGAIFRYDGTLGEILWLDMGDDIDLSDGLARSVLNIMEIRGVETVTLPLSFKVLAQKLGCKQTTENYLIDLKGFFCCNCQHK